MSGHFRRTPYPYDRSESTGYLAADTTHKIISCQLKFTTLATATINQEIADIAYIIHTAEDSESLTFAFEEVRKAILEHYEYDWQVKSKFTFLSIHLFHCLILIHTL